MSATNGFDDEFYVGYLKQAPSLHAKRLRATIAILAVGIPCLTALVAVSQTAFDRGTFEFGVTHTFEGVIYEDPVPMLHVSSGPREQDAAANYLLVGFGKAGLPPFARGHDGEKVRFKGSLIHRDAMTMIEMNDPESFASMGLAAVGEGRGRVESLGHARLVGELVDTKCFFGVMRPATGKVHRACAVRCLEGGAPPGVLVRDLQGNGVVYMLAGPAGDRLEVDPQWAALGVTVEGELELYDGVPVIRASHLALDTTR